MNPDKILIFDAEIIRAIATKPDERERYDEQGIAYVTDWSDFAGMGVACLCAPTLADALAAESGAHLYKSAMFFTQETIGNAEWYFNQFDCFVSYNGAAFDMPLLRANGCFPDDSKHYDLAAVVRGVMGRARPPKMDDLAGANGLPKKSGHGAMAPVMWQQGKQREVVEYCFQDTIVLAHLFHRVITEGYLQNPYTNQMMTIAGPTAKARLF